ncbi:MAG: CrcB family protein [Pseudolysinimonas sp.]
MNLVAVFVGGLVGTALRLSADALLPHGDDAFPLSTLLINVIGSFALGMLVSRLWPVAPEWLRFGLGAGLLGSFTTFSAVAASVVLLAQSGAWLVGLVYLFLSVAGGIGAALLGLRLGRRDTPAIGPDE